MFRIALKKAASAAAPLSCPSSLRLSISRPFSSSGAAPVARQMIDYAIHHARSCKSEESYAQALLVLEQGLNNLHRGDAPDYDAVGMVFLAMSTVLSESGDMSCAVENLQRVLELTNCSASVKVAAFEALTGLYLEMGQDSTSSVLANKYVQMLIGRRDVEMGVQQRARAAKGLVDLVIGNIGSAFKLSCTTNSGADSYLRELQGDEFLDPKLLPGSVCISHGEYLHSVGNLMSAKGLYQTALEASSTQKLSGECPLAASNMIPEEVSLGATCCLGQVAMHSGNFQEAEETLTKALTKAEELFGANHPKVGVVLTTLAMMFGHKAKMERSSSLLIQEGLYRKAIELLKAPPIDSELKGAPPYRDLVALARGGYAEALSVQSNRKAEGERMKQWAETAWKSSRLTLAEALDICEASKSIVIDTRICRVI